MPKRRLSVTVDTELLDAADAAVAEGAAEHVSDWVNAALHAQADADRRRRALDQFLAAYEDEHGAFTDRELDEIVRDARADAVVLRGTPGPS